MYEKDYIKTLLDLLKQTPKKKSSQSLTALNNLKKFRGRIPADIDAKKELAAASDEKYAKG